MSFKFINNSPFAKAAMERATKKALTAIGMVAIEKTLDYMGNTSRYGPGSAGAGIWRLGDLQRDVSKQVRVSDYAVDIGNSLEYATWVHNGTKKMPARPYLRDAISENIKTWKEIAVEHISDEF